MNEEIKNDLIKKGFQVVGTGGNCTAWALGVDGIEVLITDDASADLEGPSCSISVFDDEGHDLHYESVPIGQVADRALQLANDGADNLNGTCGQCGEQGQIRTVCGHCGRGIFDANN